MTPPSAGITFSPNVIKNANVINLYMATDWNDVAPPGLGETKEAIDSWTQALLASSYFTFAGQYTIGTPHFVGGFNSSGLCVPSISGVVSTWDVGGFVNCNLTVGALGDLVNNAHLQDILVNVFLDPRMTMGTPLWFGGTCPGSASVNAYHDANQDPSTFLQPFTVIPANTSCNANFNALTAALAHEMIEAMTDPIGMDGWVHRYGFLGGNVSYSLSCGEVSDLCAGTCTKAVSSTGNISSARPARLHQHPSTWSNSAQACVPTWPTTSPTLAAQPVIIQEDSSSVTLSISGAGFGDAVGALQSQHSQVLQTRLRTRPISC